MARSRNIKPGFFKNETLAECSPLARLLFAGLWCLADRDGRLEDRPKRIRAEVLPYDDGSVNDMLAELHRAGFILRYQVGEQGYIQVKNFDKHQNPHHREAESTIPAPVEKGANTVQASDKPMTSRADSLLLIPDSLNHHQPPSSPAASGSAKDGFSEFWNAYPKKVGKQDCEKVWNKIKPDANLLAIILSAIAIQKSSPDWNKDAGKYIPHPSSWINGKRWEDEGVTGSPSIPIPNAYVMPDFLRGAI